MRNLGKEKDTILFTEFHLLLGKLVLVVVIHSLGNVLAQPQPGVALSTQDKDPPSHAQSTRVSFYDSPAGKDQEPLTRSTGVASNNLHLELNTPLPPNRLE